MEYFFKCIFAFIITLATIFGIVYGAMWVCGVVIETDEGRQGLCFATLIIGGVIAAIFSSETVSRY